MITITDFCSPEAFSLLELDGAVCYTRLFLETILKEEHERVVIRVFIKERADSIYKESNGFTEQYIPGCFNIIIFKDTRKNMVYTLSHELVHVKQHLEDGFIIDRINNKIYWEHDEYMKLTDLIKLHREKSHELYALLPWEHDAHLTLVAISDLVTEKLETLCKNDPDLKKFMLKASKESDYNTDLTSTSGDIML